MSVITCESCGDDDIDPDASCFHDGHIYCPACLTECGECGQAIRDDYAAELSMDRGR